MEILEQELQIQKSFPIKCLLFILPLHYFLENQQENKCPFKNSPIIWLLFPRTIRHLVKKKKVTNE